MSEKYELVRGYYLTGKWDIRRVRHAVQSNWITAAEFADITGETYEYVPEEDDNAVGGAGLQQIGAALSAID